MNVKILKALSKSGYINSRSHLFPEYFIDDAHRQPGLKTMLRDLNIPFEEVAEIREEDCDRTDFGDSKIKFARQIIKFNTQLRDAMESCITSDDDFPVMIGGDHSSSIGSIAGILQKRPDCGILWIDAHSDVNTHETTETGWIYGMPAAVCCGKGHPSLVDIMKNHYIKPQNLCLFGVRYAEKGEWNSIKDWGVNIITIDDIDEMGIAEAYKTAMRYITQNSNMIHVSLDLDAIDKLYAPGVTETMVGGLTFREITYICRKLGASSLVKSLDITQGEPDMDVNYQTGKLCLELTANVLGRNYSEYDMYLRDNHI